MRPVWCHTASARGPARAVRPDVGADVVGRDGPGRATAAGGVGGVFCLYWNSIDIWLACAEGDDAPDRIVRRNADGDSVSRDHFDAEAAHSTAELGEHLVAGVALHAVEPAAVNRHDRALHIDQIVLAQTASVPFCLNEYCDTSESLVDSPKLDSVHD